MSTAQAFTTTEIEDLLVSVCTAALTGTLAAQGLPAVLEAEQIWIDEPGSGRKPEPYLRINARGERQHLGLVDRQTYAPPPSETPEAPATRTTQRDRAVPVMIDAIGPASFEIARQLADALDVPEVRGMFWAKGAGIVGGIKGPKEVPYTENNSRKYFYRVQFSLSLSESSQGSSNWIQFVELSSEQLGIPVTTIELEGGTP